MSDRSRDQATSGNERSARKESPIHSPRSSYTLQRSATGARSVTSPIAHHGSNVSLSLPPLPQVPPAGGSLAGSAPQLAGFSSILNPQPLSTDPATRRRKASELEPSRPAALSLPPIVTRPAAPPASPTAATSFSASQDATLIEQSQRRILTPRSPGLHRAASLGHLNQSVGTINARTTPFPSSPRSRTYAIEPGRSGAPPLPTPPAVARAGYGFPGAEQSAQSSHWGNIDYRNLSSSASPSTSYSSYSQAGQVSPLLQHASASATAVPGAAMGGSESTYSANRQASVMADPTGPERQRPLGIPISSSGGPNVYQMMSLETTSGTVQLPVDVQAASRVADEKRRRNAGASARFRQRRKEKERESTSAISVLERQVKELAEDADFYRQERNSLADILIRVPGGDRHFPRPPSPRRHRRRSSIMSLPGPTGTGSAAFPAAQEQSMQSPGEGRNVRRRTSTMSLPPPPPPPHLNVQATGVQPSFAPQPFGGPLGPPPPPPVPQRVPFGEASMQGGPLPGPSEFPRQNSQQLPGLPQVLNSAPQWGSYQSSQRPQDPRRPREGQ